MKQTNHFLDHFFNPKSVAIVGATNNPFKMNYRLLQNLISLDFKGKIYPVNFNEQEVQGVRAFARLQDIPGNVDLVVTSVPASKTMDIVRDCGEIGAKNLVIVTGGFSEGGEQGQELHRELGSFVREKGIRTLGPNTLSPVNTSNNLTISFNPVKKIKRGGLSFAFQSGFYEPKINWLFSQFGINKMLDMGNKIDINELDALAYFSDDPDTKVIAMHMESLHSDGREFFDLLKAVSPKKPTIILKSGRTKEGSKAAASHTGSIAGENDLIFDGMIKQTAAMRARNLDEFFDLAKAFDFSELPHGNRMAIITLSGGEGVMATDACEMNGLKLARISNRTAKSLEKIFPDWEIPLNPFDAGVCMEFHLSDISTFFETLAAIPEDENVDCVIMQMPPHLPSGGTSSSRKASEKEKFIQTLSRIKMAKKPFALWRTGMDGEEDRLIEMLESNSLPVFQSSERAIRALSAMHRYSLKCSLA
ncbi:MAG: CoA-binding protein [Deltaproteobacteria bacterium]|nr:CoA-binding protein [Deltaproteobacteria bacterium]